MQCNGTGTVPNVFARPLDIIISEIPVARRVQHRYQSLLWCKTRLGRKNLLNAIKIFSVDSLVGFYSGFVNMVLHV